MYIGTFQPENFTGWGSEGVNRGNTEGTNSLKICVGSLCMYALFYVCVRIDFADCLEKGFIYIYIYTRGF